MKILLIGLGYVGTANAILLSQQNEVVCYDLDIDRIDQINKKISPIEDKEASQYLSQKNLNIKGVIDFPSENDFDFVIVNVNKTIGAQGFACSYQIRRSFFQILSQYQG